MGWLFKSGCSRPELIEQRTKDWERTTPDGMTVTSTCLAHCYRGNSFSGVLWSVWERTFNRDDHEAEPTQRWIQCDLLRHQRDFDWGYKDMEESMGPYYFSCPLKYLRMVPIEQYSGNATWREQVVLHHQHSLEKRRQRRAAKCQ